MAKSRHKRLQDIEDMRIDETGKIVIQPKEDGEEAEKESEKDAKRILSCIRSLTRRGVIIKTSHRRLA